MTTEKVLEALTPLLQRVRRDVTALKPLHRKEGVSATFWAKDGVLNKTKMMAHLEGGDQRGCCPINAGESTVRCAVLDFDSHGGETPWEEMQAVAEKVQVALEAAGQYPLMFRSSGGRGVHLIMLWDEPQDAASVRAHLRSVIGALGFKDGTGGVVAGEIEVFPKQDSVPADGYGNYFILPLGGKSRFIAPVWGLIEDNEAAADEIEWQMSADVPETLSTIEDDDDCGFGAALAAQPTDLTKEQVLEVLGRADVSTMGNDEWVRVGMAIYHQFRGSEEGFEVFNEWSAGDTREGQYDERECRKRWDSFKADRLNRITFKSMLSTYGQPSGVKQSVGDDYADQVLYAIAGRVGVDADTVAKRIGYQPQIVGKIINCCAWDPLKAKFFIMHEGLKICGREDLATFTYDLFDDMYSHGDLEAMAEEKILGMTESKANTFIKGVMSAAVNKVAAIIRVRRQFTAVHMDVDPFRTEDELWVKDAIAHLGYQHQRLIGGAYDPEVVADFRQHFPELDSFLDLLVAARFASDRKQAHLWLQAPSNWGKSFMLGCLAHHGLVVETSVSELDKIMAGGPVGKTIADFLRAWVLAIDEFKGVTKEIKLLSDHINFAPKGLSTVKSPLYLKIFLSAEDVPSLANRETGVEDQFASRFTHVKVAGRLDSRALFMASKGDYRDSIINYVAERVNALVDGYVAMGVKGSRDAADGVVAEFFAQYRIDREFNRMSEDTIHDLTNSFVDWVKGAAEQTNLVSVFDGGTGMATANERAASSHVSVCSKTGQMFVRAASKVFDLWLDSEFDKHRRGTVGYKKDQIIKSLGGTQRVYVNGHRTHWLPIIHVDDKGRGTK